MFRRRLAGQRNWAAKNMSAVEIFVSTSCLGPQLIWTDNIDWRETIKYPDCIIDGLWPEFDVGTFCPWVGNMQHNLRGQLGNSLDLLMVRSYTTELEVQNTLKVVDANRLLSVWYVFIVNDSSLAKASRRDLLLMVSAAYFDSWQKLFFPPLAWSTDRVPHV